MVFYSLKVLTAQKPQFHNSRFKTSNVQYYLVHIKVQSVPFETIFMKIQPFNDVITPQKSQFREKF